MTTLARTVASVTASNVGPLTTTFTPAPSCTDNFYTAGIYYSIGGPLASQCFPSNWASTSQFYSPGVCPKGYTQACSSVTGTETHATCCPSGYVCYTPSIFNFVGQACASIFPSQITTTVTNGTDLRVMLATLHPSTEAVNGYGVSIRYAANDFVSSSTSTGSSSTSNTRSQTTSSSPASTTSISTSTSLSSGAKIGIAVGIAAIVILAVIALSVFIMRKRRAAGQQRKNQMPETPFQEVDASPVSWEDGKKTSGAAPTVHEIYTAPRVVELESQDRGHG